MPLSVTTTGGAAPIAGVVCESGSRETPREKAAVPAVRAPGGRGCSQPSHTPPVPLRSPATDRPPGPTSSARHRSCAILPRPRAVTEGLMTGGYDRILQVVRADGSRRPQPDPLTLFRVRVGPLSDPFGVKTCSTNDVSQAGGGEHNCQRKGHTLRLIDCENYFPPPACDAVYRQGRGCPIPPVGGRGRGRLSLPASREFRGTTAPRAACRQSASTPSGNGRGKGCPRHKLGGGGPQKENPPMTRIGGWLALQVRQ